MDGALAGGVVVAGVRVEMGMHCGSHGCGGGGRGGSRGA